MAKIKVTPGELRSLGGKCKAESTKIDGVMRTVRGAITSTDWDSPAATRFKQDWSTKFETALRELTESLASLGKAAETMAANYEQTEASYKGG